MKLSEHPMSKTFVALAVLMTAGVAQALPFEAAYQPDSRFFYRFKNEFENDETEGPRKRSGKIDCTVVSAGRFDGEPLFSMRCSGEPSPDYPVGWWWGKDSCYGLRSDGMYEYYNCPKTLDEYRRARPGASAIVVAAPSPKRFRSKTFTIDGKKETAWSARPATQVDEENMGDDSGSEMWHSTRLGPVQWSGYFYGGFVSVMSVQLVSWKAPGGATPPAPSPAAAPSVETPWIVLAGSVEQSSPNARAQAQKTVQTLQAAGFADAKVVDGRQFPKFRCCFWSVVAGAFTNQADAKALVARLKERGFSAYAKRGW